MAVFFVFFVIYLPSSVVLICNFFLLGGALCFICGFGTGLGLRCNEKKDLSIWEILVLLDAWG